MSVEQFMIEQIQAVVSYLYGHVETSQIQLQKTRKEFEGDYTLVTFPLLKLSRKAPEATANEIGEHIVKNNPTISSFNVIKGFLNLSIAPAYWAERFAEEVADENYGQAESSGRTIMIEYSSPNTNKPLHLGHIRNNLLGYSVATILKANGHNVIKVNLVNDRGIHICKSMLAWQKFGNGETPENSGKKGDHLIGDYYVAFDKHYRAEVKELAAKFMAEGMDEEAATEKAKAEAEATTENNENND